MLHVDIPARDEIHALLEHRGPASVTLYLETTPLTQEIDASRIALKNLAAEAATQLAAAGAHRKAILAVQEQIDDLIDDDAFWRFQARSLAIFVTPDHLSSFRLPNALAGMVQVSDRFHVKPLLRAVSFPQVAHVLALAAGGVRLLEVTADTVAEVKVAELPRDAADAAGKASIKGRSMSGRIQGSEGEKVRLRQYARQVDQALRDLLHGDDVPLILAASENLGALYRSVNSYPHLLAAGIIDSPDTLDDASLGRLARGLLDATYRKEVADFNALLVHRENQGRTVTDVALAARAAVRGAIDTVLVDIDAVLTGTLDPETGAIAFAPEGAASYGLVDEIARLTILAGGRVLAVRKDDIPGGHPVAAILRFPLG